MAARKSNKSKRSRKQSGKVGSDPHAARKFGGQSDFGVPETGRERDREYVSRTTKSNDPGAMPEHSLGEGTRTTGVGGNASGDGSSSGGDLDTDIVGVGTGGSGVSASGPDERTEGPDMVGGDKPTSARKRNPTRPRGREIVRGSTVDHSGGDASTTGDGQGSNAVTNPARNDDSFAGEINMDEASGADNSRSDNRR